MTPSTLPIQPRVAEQAAKDYLAIERAGMLHILDMEIRESIEAYQGRFPGSDRPMYERDEYFARRLDRWKDGNGWNLREPYSFANNLANLLDCPASAVTPYVVPELIDGTTRRTIVLDCLRNVANRARKEMAQQQRRRSA